MLPNSVERSKEVHIARELGAQKIEMRINFIWALKFPTMDAVKEFEKVLIEQHEDYRGPHDFGDEARGICIGWRQRF